MNAKLYREIINCIDKQYSVISSFEKERSKSFDKETIIFISVLYNNIDLLKERIEKILDKGE
jgi:hypothetical protein